MQKYAWQAYSGAFCEKRMRLIILGMNKQQFESYCDRVLLPRIKKLINDSLDPVQSDVETIAAEIARLNLLSEHRGAIGDDTEDEKSAGNSALAHGP